jgi:hypothetical protein
MTNDVTTLLGVHDTSEKYRALILATTVVGRPNADPDDDIVVISRQLLRSEGEIDRLQREFAEYMVQRMGRDNEHK